jgi:hypothetical protein
VLARFVAPAAEHAHGIVLFTEMLPGPEDCWLEDSNGRYTSCGSSPSTEAGVPVGPHRRRADCAANASLTMIDMHYSSTLSTHPNSTRGRAWTLHGRRNIDSASARTTKDLI